MFESCPGTRTNKLHSLSFIAVAKKRKDILEIGVLERMIKLEKNHSPASMGF